MNEILKPAGQWFAQNISLSVLIVLLILSIFFKIPKKEINVLGWFVGWIGKAFTRELRNDIKEMKEDSNKQIIELRTDLDTFEENTNKAIEDMRNGTNSNCELLKTRLDAMERSNDMQSIRQIKAHILDFANSCRNGVKHTMEDFKNVLSENAEYDSLVEKYDMKNDVYTEDLKFIKKVYQHCLETNSFLA